MNLNVSPALLLLLKQTALNCSPKSETEGLSYVFACLDGKLFEVKSKTRTNWECFITLEWKYFEIAEIQYGADFVKAKIVCALKLSSLWSWFLLILSFCLHKAQRRGIGLGSFNICQMCASVQFNKIEITSLVCILPVVV